jgi:glycosyltransferase involved in cell wall biosynthesis
MANCSIVVPVHNEAENLYNLFMQFWDNLGDLREKITEIHLMENGSNDDTLSVCKELEKKFPDTVIAQKVPFPSYGEAVKQGILSSLGETICILECDAMDVSFVSSSLAIIEEGRADFVVASKRHPKSRDLRPFKRRMLTYLFNLWLKLFFKFPGSDTHGLKTIRTETAKSICRVSITGDEVFQTEIVLLAHRMGFKVTEIPICLAETRDTKVAVYRRLPKVMNIIAELKRSLARFPVKK